jgi:class 3 adenylate cyclase/tetratricopeptide (TPR) repeat protein
MSPKDQMSSKYHLVAIMFTDIVGYSAMMGADEKRAIQRIRKNREIQKPLIEKFEGKWLKEMGDGIMSSFHTASDAIHCAIEIQRQLKNEPDINIRIGIHLGEVIVEEDDIYGDGVNIASRIESMADPGGIYITEIVQKSVRSKSHIKTKYIGELELKNIDFPVNVYAILDDHLPVPKKRKADITSGGNRIQFQYRFLLTFLIILIVTAGLLWIKPWKINRSFSSNNSLEASVVAVFPFSIKGNEELNYLGEGMVDLISTKLDGMPGFKALDPNIIISDFKRQTITDHSPEELFNIAGKWGAGRIILGNIMQFGDSYRIKLSYYETSSGVDNSAEVVIGSEDEFLSGIDQLVRKTIARELVKRGMETEGLAAYTSNNIGALKSFLEGESLRRDGKYDLANNKYMEAIRLDSTMCLSWLRMWQTCTWENICAGSRDEILSMVQRYDENLSPKLKGYVKAMFGFYYNRPEAEQQFRDLIKIYGENVDFLIGLGEVLYHFNEIKGRMASEAIPYFLKAWEYDPDNSEVLHHLVQLLAYEEDTVTLNRVVEKINYNMDFWYTFKAIHLLVSGKEWSDAQLLQLLNHPDFNWPTLFWRCSIETLLNRFIKLKDNLERINGRPFPQPEREPFNAITYIWQGKENQAIVILKNHPARKLLPYLVPLVNTGTPFSYFVNQSPCDQPSMDSGRITGPFPDDFILALNALDRSNLKSFRHYAGRLESWIGKQENPPDYLLAYLHAIAMRVQENFRESNEIISQILNEKQINLPEPFFGFFIGSLLLAKAENHYTLGENNEAFRWYRARFNVLGASDEFVVGYSFLRRAEILTRLGKPEDALRYYERFLQLYKNCDAKYSSWIEKAKAERDLILYPKKS